MKRTGLAAAAVAALAAASAAGAQTVPAGAVRDLRTAAKELEQAAALGNVADDQTEARHLLAARDLLREVEPLLGWSQRLQATMLEHEIGRDVRIADDAYLASRFLPMPSNATARVERNDLAELARRGVDLARQTADARRAADAARSVDRSSPSGG